MSDDVGELPGMPEPYRLQRFCADGETIIKRGPYVVGRYEDDDLGLRNLVIVSLRQAGHSGEEVAACFGMSVQYVSKLRCRAKKSGSLGVVRQMGRPRKLSDAKVAKARTWAAQGVANAEIARRLGVHPGTIGRLLGRVERIERATEQALELNGDPAASAGAADDRPEGSAETGTPADSDEPTDSDERTEPSATSLAVPDAPRRIQDGVCQSRYAGAMLLHPFLGRLGVSEVLAGLPVGPARRYNAASLVLSAVFGFALGISSLEGAKHLRVSDAGALVGAESFPHLRTLRPRLKALAEVCDPLAIQRSFAMSMLAADERPPELFYVDDHFVTYWGARPVAKGYNIRRHLAEPGRDDTFVVDAHWRAICFASGEPKGLSVSLPGVLGQLREITGDRRVMVGFDRGGSYPKVFAAIAAAGMDWVTWRRAPLVAPGVEPRRSWVEVGRQATHPAARR